MKKLIAGIVIALLGLGMDAGAIISIARNLPKSGPLAGKITGYVPPFPGHGLYMVILLAAGVILLLVGIMIAAVASEEREYR